MDPILEGKALQTRRQFFGKSALGLGKAKRVIYLFQNGAPSHVDLFDYKPKLREWHGKQIPDEVVGGRRFSTMTGGQTERPVLGEITQFAQHGKSGAWVSDFLPRTAAIADMPGVASAAAFTR